MSLERENKNCYSKILVKDEMEVTSKSNDLNHYNVNNDTFNGSKNKDNVLNKHFSNTEEKEEENVYHAKHIDSNIKENLLRGYGFAGVSYSC